MKILKLDRIREALAPIDLLPGLEAGFVAYSRGRAVVPPVGELLLEEPPGEVHIKYGYIQGGDYYVIKIASGFYENPRRGLPSGNGMMLVFHRETGEPVAALLDEGHLTDVRTAAAGAIVARYLAPRRVRRIGILGSGVQARLQLLYLKEATDCTDVIAWGRSPERLERYREEMSAKGYTVETASEPGGVAAEANLIVTTTPATAPLLAADQIRPGTHITAVGSDTPTKQELDVGVLARADLVVGDSILQCRERGEIHHALGAGSLRERDVVELGKILAAETPGRTADDQITVADLTGVAVQDIQIATAVLDAVA